MERKLLSFIWVIIFCGLTGSAQDIAVTFTGTGTATVIDSVTATNLASDESITMPGGATLLLTPKTGLPTINSVPATSMVYPNPFQSQATLLTDVNEPQMVKLTVRDLSGRRLTGTREPIQPGENSFTITLSTPGIYLATLETSAGTTTHKLICTSGGSGNQVKYLGSATSWQNNDTNLHLTTDHRQSTTHNTKLKSSLSGYFLGYSAGDIIRFHCFSGDFNTVFTDSPVETKTYEVSFPPIAAITITPGNGTTEDRFTLDASACCDAETTADELEVRWDLNGDSIWDTDYDQSKTIVNQFPLAGSYKIWVQVKDPGGLTDSIFASVDVSYPAFTDSRDGHVYHYKRIGAQYWMTENMAYLPAVSPPELGSEDGSGNEKYYYVYDYHGTSVSEAKATDNYAVYGVLYNWPAAATACPTGWHVPDDEEWKTLEKYMGMSGSDPVEQGWRSSGSVGGKLKEAGTAHWKSPNSEATNSSGFTALPAGIRSAFDSFMFLGAGAAYMNIEIDDTWVWARNLFNNEPGVFRGTAVHYAAGSVRCIKD